jgi:hypothetical protein
MMGIRFVLAVLAGGVVASMTDWLFMGDLIYKRFDRHPQIWRFRGGQGESKAIAWSAWLPFLTCAVFDFLCVHQSVSTYSSTFGLALGVWLAVALPMIVANAIWMKVTAAIAVSFSIGWLVKLLVAAFFLVLIVR